MNDNTNEYAAPIRVQLPPPLPIEVSLPWNDVGIMITKNTIVTSQQTLRIDQLSSFRIGMSNYMNGHSVPITKKSSNVTIIITLICMVIGLLLFIGGNIIGAVILIPSSIVFINCCSAAKYMVPLYHLLVTYPGSVTSTSFSGGGVSLYGVGVGQLGSVSNSEEDIYQTTDKESIVRIHQAISMAMENNS